MRAFSEQVYFGESILNKGKIKVMAMTKTNKKYLKRGAYVRVEAHTRAHAHTREHTHVRTRTYAHARAHTGTHARKYNRKKRTNQGMILYIRNSKKKQTFMKKTLFELKRRWGWRISRHLFDHHSHCDHCKRYLF